MNKNLYIVILIIALIGGFFWVQSTYKTQKSSKNISTQSHRSYQLNTIRKPDPLQIQLNQPFTISYRINNDKNEVVKDFDVVHEKIMHFIIVRKDLQKFQHLHPKFNKQTGEFDIEVTLSADGPYKFFADFTPGNDNPMKLPVALSDDLIVGDISTYQPIPLQRDTESKKNIPPDYEVEFIFPDQLVSGKEFSYSLNIFKAKKKVTDLQNYLGALGHSVILQEGTLEYIHTHPQEKMSSNEHKAMGHSMQSDGSASINFSTTLPKPGKYKSFTQFKHQDQILNAEYVIDLKE